MPSPLDLLQRIPPAVRRLVESEDQLDQLGRIALRAPRSFDVYRPEVLARAARFASGRDEYRLRALRPSQFLDLALPMPGGAHSASKISSLEDMLRTGRALEENMADQSGWYWDRYGSEFKGLGEVPFLQLAPSGDASQVVGHEGRHRMSALRRYLGEEPLAVRLSGRWRLLDELTAPGRELLPEASDRFPGRPSHRLEEWRRGGLAALRRPRLLRERVA